MPHVSDEVSELASKIARAPFEVISSSVEAEHVQLQPEVTDGFWLGEDRHPITLDAVAPDWTPDSIAWIANLLAESCHRIGVKTSILINVSKK